MNSSPADAAILSTQYSQSKPNAPAKILRWLLFVGVFLLLWRLGYAPFWNPDEGRYASSSREMAGLVADEKPNWVVPHLNTIPRLNKPPLVYWLAAGSFTLFGASEWAGRLGSALAAIGVMLLLWRLGTVMFSERAGIFAALVWTTSLLSFGMARVLNTDMLLTASVALVLFGIWNALENSETSARKWQYSLIAGIGMGLALLSKGPVGVALPLGVGFVHLCAARRWKRVPWVPVTGAISLALLISAPWYLAANARNPQFLQHFLGEENLKRFSGGEHFHDATSPFFYVPVVLGGLLPWTMFLIPAALQWRRREDDAPRRARLFLWLWSVLIVLFFSASSTKLISYVLPAFPAFALLIGEAISTLFSTQSKAKSFEQWLERLPLFLTVIVNIGLVIGARIALTNGKLLSYEEGAMYSLLLGGILFFGSVLLILAWRSRDVSRVALAQIGTMTALVLCALSLAGRAALYEDSSALTKALAPHLKTGDTIIQSSFQPTSIFYTARPITIALFKNTSGLDEDALRRSPYFPHLSAIEGSNAQADKSLLDAEDATRKKIISRALHKPTRVFVLLRRKDWPDIHTSLRGIRLIGRNSDFDLISNRPAPAGFAFDHVAPRKK